MLFRSTEPVRRDIAVQDRARSEQDQERDDKRKIRDANREGFFMRRMCHIRGRLIYQTVLFYLGESVS